MTMMMSHIWKFMVSPKKKISKYLGKKPIIFSLKKVNFIGDSLSLIYSCECEEVSEISKYSSSI